MGNLSLLRFAAMKYLFAAVVLVLGLVPCAHAQETTRWQSVSLVKLLAAMEQHKDATTREIAKAHFAGAVMAIGNVYGCRGNNPGPIVEHAYRLLSLKVATDNTPNGRWKYEEWSASFAIMMLLKDEWTCK